MWVSACVWLLWAASLLMEAAAPRRTLVCWVLLIWATFDCAASWHRRFAVVWSGSRALKAWTVCWQHAWTPHCVGEALPQAVALWAKLCCAGAAGSVALCCHLASCLCAVALVRALCLHTVAHAKERGRESLTDSDKGIAAPRWVARLARLTGVWAVIP